MSLKHGFGGPLPPKFPTMIWKKYNFGVFWTGYMLIMNYPYYACVEMADWVIKNLNKKGKIENWAYNQWWGHSKIITNVKELKDGPMVIFFKNEADAMAFKMIWEEEN